MFTEITENKKSDRIPFYYHNEFIMFSNGMEQGYEGFIASHKNVFDSGIQYLVRYDDSATVDSGENLAMRVFIDVWKDQDIPTTIEIVLIARFKDEKIYRLWETTYPDWTHIPYFENYGN